MKTSVTHIALISAAFAVFSSGALAHEEFSETGPYHEFRHLQDSRAQAGPEQTSATEALADQQRGAMGPVRSVIADDQADLQRDLDRRLGGIGGSETN